MFPGLLAAACLIITQTFSAPFVRSSLLNARNSGRGEKIMAEIKLRKRVDSIAR